MCLVLCLKGLGADLHSRHAIAIPDIVAEDAEFHTMKYSVRDVKRVGTMVKAGPLH